MPEPVSDPSASRCLVREVEIVAVLTVLGGIVRLWGLSSLGLVHFDEGIYALAGLWSLSPGGLASLDPTVIAYAPPGFPFLVGISYLFLGVSDIAAILVSIVAGTLTIPATAWLARRTFGAGAGAFAAALVAFSGFHIAFSRMALTDASFLLLWVLGLIAAQRFIERPRITSAIILGLSVGLAQLFKYNGWLIGAIVILSAGAGLIFDAKERNRSRLLAICDLGLLAVLVSAAVYWQWFRFVEAHGGYARLLAHHQSYMGGTGSWLPHLRLQLEEEAEMSGGAVREAAIYLVASVCLQLVVLPRTRRQIETAVAYLILTLPVFVLPHFYWFAGAIWMLWADRWTRRQRIFGVSWLFLSILTPFYHPYVRLWLPLQHLGWVILPGLISVAADRTAAKSSGPHSPLTTRPYPWVVSVMITGCLWMIYGVVFVTSLSIMGPFQVPSHFGTGELPRPGASSDSLRDAVAQVLANLPPGTVGLRLLARPPVTFYLGGRIAARVEPNLESLLVSGNPKLWALVDVAQLRQEGDLKMATEKLLTRWEIVHEYPTHLNLPTLLDVDPGAARPGRSEAVNAPLWLLRPRSKGTP